ncbi:hypothetical protein Aab01nite_60740 [Paractinoplanes abujensis]|nr:hypothetical protein Aab01nite_60740 [Actinoplanes abujensis]
MACTLPAVERPVRVAEFDELFATVLLGQMRQSETVLGWDFDPAAEAVVRELAGRENECCSFFEFRFERIGGVLRVAVEVPVTRVAVLDALEQRAAVHLN